MQTFSTALPDRPRTGVPEYAALLILVGSMAGYYVPRAKSEHFFISTLMGWIMFDLQIFKKDKFHI